MSSGPLPMLRKLWRALTGRADVKAQPIGAHEVGDRGEKVAAAWLRRQGYKILQRNVRSRLGEIDIVASHHGVLCFVEVKTRSSDAFGGPAAAVHKAKQRQIQRVALDFAQQRGLTQAECRFDVVAVTLPKQGEPQVELFQGAFAMSSSV